MTALKGIDKLETTGLWRAHEDAQRREVFVSVGDDTLIISDVSNSALSHWSLPAVRRRNPGVRPAVFAPGRDATEELEIDDTTMIDAIESIRTALERTRPRPGRIRWLTLSLITLGIVALSVFWVPRALLDHTTRVMPMAQQVTIGRGMLNRIAALAGQPCIAPRSHQVLAQLNARVLPGAGARLAILPGAPQPTMHLPGGFILLSGVMLENAATPEVFGGYLAAEYLRSQDRDPLRHYLEFAGFQETLRLLTRGETNPATLRAFVERKLTTAPQAIPADTLDAWFRQLKLPLAPYLQAIGAPAQPQAAADTPPVLSDAQWLTLKNICE